jgi:GLPGLI family protein
MNLKNSIVSVIFIMMALLVNAQDKELYVEYQFETKDGNSYEPIQLRANHQQSLSIIRKDMFPGGPVEGVPREMLEKMKYEITHVYMDYRENIIESDELLSFGIGMPERMCIKEKLNDFKWQITGNKEEVLGYQCQEAKTSFRGRDYLAWFTTEVPFKAGPWKLNGLPGVILKVKTVDDFLKIEAKLLKIQEAKEITSPIDNSDILSWEKFEKYYKKSVKSSEASLRSVMTKVGAGGHSLPKEISYPRIEIIIDANRASGSGKTFQIKVIQGNLEDFDL